MVSKLYQILGYYSNFVPFLFSQMFLTEVKLKISVFTGFSAYLKSVGDVYFEIYIFQVHLQN